MVTTEEINQAEKQLSQVEAQAKQQSQTKIPRRRFGTRVTAKQQQDILKQRQQAEQTLRQVNEQRQQLQSIKQDISSQQSTENKYGYLSKLANSSIPTNLLIARRKEYGLTKDEVNTISEIRSGQLNIQKIKDQQAQFNREGIKPITNSQGQIIGFLDEKRQQSIPIENISKIASSSSEDYNRYARAGIIKVEPTIREQIQLQSLTPEQRNKVVLSREVMSYREPTNRLNQFRTGIQQSKNPISNVIRTVVNTPVGRNQTIGGTATKTVDFFSNVFDVGEQANPLNRPQTRLSKTLNKDVRIISEIAFYSATAPITVPILTVSGLNRIYTSTNSNEFFTGVFEAGVVVFAGIGKASRFFKEPINLDVSKQVSRRYLDEIKYIQDNPTQLANFKIISYKPPTQITYETRIDILKRSIITQEPNIIFPKRIVTLDDASVQFIRSGTARVKEGKILGSVNVISGKFGKRYSGTTFNKLYGETLPLESLPSKRNKEILKATEEYLGFPVSQKNFDLIFGASKDASGGGLVQKELFKIQSGNKIKFTPKGKRIRQAETTGITIREKQISETIDIFEGSLNIKDITFPKFREGKDIQIKGITRTEELIPSESSLKVSKPISKERRLELKDVQKTQELLNDLKANTLVNLPKIKTVTTTQAKSIITNQLTSYDTAPLIVGGRGLAKSKYYGTGQYERSEPISTFKQPSSFIELSNNKNISASLPKFNLKEVERSITKSVTKEVPREIARELPREISRTLNRQINREISRTLQRQLNRQVNKNTGRDIFNFRNKSYNSKEVFGFKPNKKSSQFEGTKGFKTFFFVGGKKIYLGGLSAREQAILKGEKATLKSLSARFGIEESNQIIKDNNVNVRNDLAKYFREYKIRQNKVIKTPNIFIQKRGKRLVSKAERQLIQSARKNSKYK